MKQKGIESAPLTSRRGYEQTRLMHQFFERRRVRDLQFTQYLTNAMFVMAGLPGEVPPDRRFEALEDIYDRYVETVTGDRFTVEQQKKRALEKYRKARERKEYFDKLEAIGRDDFDLAAWIRGDI